jgi:hypothetical protein
MLAMDISFDKEKNMTDDYLTIKHQLFGKLIASILVKEFPGFHRTQLFTIADYWSCSQRVVYSSCPHNLFLKIYFNITLLPIHKFSIHYVRFEVRLKLYTSSSNF